MARKTKGVMIMNLNDLAKKITLKEGKKLNLSIAQVKEVMHIFLHELKDMSIVDVANMLKKYK
jgi:hypothetical protein